MAVDHSVHDMARLGPRLYDIDRLVEVSDRIVTGQRLERSPVSRPPEDRERLEPVPLPFAFAFGAFGEHPVTAFRVVVSDRGFDAPVAGPERPSRQTRGLLRRRRLDQPF